MIPYVQLLVDVYKMNLLLKKKVLNRFNFNLSGLLLTSGRRIQLCSDHDPKRLVRDEERP